MNIFETSNADTRVWMRAVMAEGGTDDAQTSLEMMGAGLRALRERLTVEEAAQLGSHLPQQVRGMFFEGWDPAARGWQSKTELLTMLDRLRPAAEGATSVASVLFRVVKDQMLRAETTVS